jgi:hypothetical protein
MQQSFIWFMDDSSWLIVKTCFIPYLMHKWAFLLQ